MTDFDPDIPEPTGDFANRLRQLYEPPADPPAGLDAAILREAHARLDRRVIEVPASRWRPFADMRVWAAAASIALVAWVTIERGAFVRTSEFAVHDIDRNGTVDVLDAFRLARALDGGEPVDRRWDVNRNGTVGRDDIDAIALAAVSISEATP